MTITNIEPAHLEGGITVDVTYDIDGQTVVNREVWTMRDYLSTYMLIVATRLKTAQP